MLFDIRVGDCLLVMADLASDSIDAIVTDPPYGLGFMGKAWDKGVPGVEFWQEMLRVAKPGAYLLAFGGTRTSHRMTCAIEDAGWEIRDTIMWIYGSGFPKSHNLGDGRGTALKPAWEPIIMARKPLVGTVAANVGRYGTGALNIDLCRIPTDEALRAGAGVIPCRHDEQVPRGRAGEESARRRYDEVGGTNFAATPGPRGGDARGRWPANVMHDGSDEVLAAFPDALGQQGVAKDDGEATGNAVYGAMRNITNQPAPRVESDKSAARFFYCAKASRKDRNDGLEGMQVFRAGERAGGRAEGSAGLATAYAGTRTPGQNIHPTVKPTELMRYLVRLVTPPGGTILDPFCGSGSTGKAALREGFRFIGIEREVEYAAIAERRVLAAAQEQMFA